MTDVPAEKSKRLGSLLRFLDTDPQNLPLLLDAADAALDAHRPGTAHDLLERYAALAPMEGRAANLAALSAMQGGRFAEAAAAFRALLEGNRDDPAVRFNLAWSLAMTKDFSGALAILDDVTARALPQAAMLRVQVLHQCGALDEAEPAARAYVELFPDHCGLMAAVSVLAIDIEDEDLAARCATAAGDHPDALTTKGTLALGDDRAVSALDLFARALAVNPESPRALIGSGLAKLMSGQADAAPADLDRGAQLFGTHPGSWIAAGWGHFVNGDRETSRQRFQTALDLDPSFAESHGSLAVLDVLDGRTGEAKRRSETALRLDRQCYSAALAQSLLSARSNPKQAQDIFNLALNTPVDGGGRTIAQSLARMGMRSG